MVNFLFAEKDIYPKLSLLTFLSALAYLVIRVILSPHHLVYDEHYFYPNIAYLHDVGLNTFIHTYKGQAPGPLYEFVHYLTYLCTKNIFFVRFDNLLFSFLNMLLIGLILKETGCTNYKLNSLLYICIPLSWVNSGLALTETPTIMCSLLSFFFLSKMLDQPRATIWDVVVISACLTLAVVGRSTFLVEIIAIGLFFFYKIRAQRYALLYIALLSSIAPFCLFYTWKGLVPPNQAFLSEGGGFSVYHFVLAIAYAGICLFIMYPNVLINAGKRPVWFLLIAALAFVILMNYDILIPMQTVSLLHTVYVRYAVTLFYALFSALFITRFVTNAMEEDKDIYILLSIFLLLLIGTSLRITHQFSTRYAFQTVPFLILVFRKYHRNNLLQFLINTFGIIMGIISLQGYYHT